MTKGRSGPAWALEIEDAVAKAEPSVVRVHARRRHASTGFGWGDGLIVTTRRAVKNADRARIVLADGSSAEAEVVGKDRGTDVAVLRTEAEVPAAPRRTLDGLSVGHPCVALGRPGDAIRASLRIVGVLGPQTPTPHGGTLDRWVETDRALPAGFSGGPLVDIGSGQEGEVIGMNTRGLLRGADLAVPNATLERVVAELVSHGGVRRGWLGVGVYPVRIPDAARGPAGAERGTMIVALQDDGPSAKAGLLLGDVLLEIDGEATAHPRRLYEVLASRADAPIRAKLLRAGQVVERDLTTGTRTR